MNPDHLIPLIGVVLGIPAIAMSARWVLRPIIDAYVRGRELKAGAQADPGRMAAQERRIAEVEGELAALRQEVERLSAVESFYNQLQAGATAGGRELPPGGQRPA